MYPKSIQKLIDLFSKFPTVGPRTAARFVFYLLKLSKEEIGNLISAVAKLKENVKLCKLCFQPFEPSTSSGQDGELCEICKNPARDKSLLCIVEKESDLVSIEKIKKYNGLYFVLGGTVSTLRKKDVEKLRLDELKERAKKPEIKEIIIAINPTTEGEATTLYLERLLKPLGKKITRLGRGLPIGAELEYADEETLSSALESRR
ncbi:MAG: recombination protein RecR [Candidatus Nealsonbacteria bacterium CG23_combo_of_CG06-09_8_20_14_all_39_25]|uniref:Recombination protein RecR n=1 Tax=Candidatus Nealsonbacteria bacterium CG23_combo_of_CG06-09_8_20_14_all_39_25 TaxID=1974723 RepID=A0A2G9YT92_9BACT|nr:MAG: recombination protein RecR [Candidatus Nealsonbacteria bacterium CG23_combo_of_CG06-09_8_20_14_all_39_25]